MKKMRLALVVFGLFVFGGAIIAFSAYHNKTNASTCPANITGQWVGAYGTQASPFGAIETDFTNPGWNNQLTGFVRYKFSVADAWSDASWTATINCNTWYGVATLTSGEQIDFSGTISPDGNSIEATYSGGLGQYWLVRQPNEPVKVGIGDTTIFEGDPGTTRTENIEVSLTSPSTQAISVTYRIDPVNADGQDVDCRKCGINQKVNFPVLTSGKTAVTKNIPIKVWGDSVLEGDESIKITIVSVTGASGIINNESIATIKNDD